MNFIGKVQGYKESLPTNNFYQVKTVLQDPLDYRSWMMNDSLFDPTWLYKTPWSIHDFIFK